MENIPTIKNERIEKPDKLFVSAQTKGIEELLPQEGRHRGHKEGAVIFATPDKTLASIFLVEGHNDSWMEIGYFNDIPYTAICMSREDFIKKDRGGTMYEVPSEHFDFNPDIGMGEKEWTSTEPTRPNEETNYPSALDTMINNGVYVFFVDKETFIKIKESEDHGFEILSTLTPENIRRKLTMQTFAKAVESNETR
jgi:hypothetical protein